MKTYVRCDACQAEGTPQWEQSAGLGGQSLGGYGYWKPPAGWAELGGYILCETCGAMVRAYVKSLVEKGR